MNDPNEFYWADKLGHRGRKPFLLLVRGEEVLKFEGATINGVVAILGMDWKKNGKWSHTTYRLRLADGVRAIAGRMGRETGGLADGIRAATGAERCDTWGEAALAIGVSRAAAERLVRRFWPDDAGRFDSTRAGLTPDVRSAMMVGMEGAMIMTTIYANEHSCLEQAVAEAIKASKAKGLCVALEAAEGGGFAYRMLYEASEYVAGERTTFYGRDIDGGTWAVRLIEGGRSEDRGE
jgi:hypothetical protein